MVNKAKINNCVRQEEDIMTNKNNLPIFTDEERKAEGLLTLKEIAEMIGCVKETSRKWCKECKIEPLGIMVSCIPGMHNLTYPTYLYKPTIEELEELKQKALKSNKLRNTIAIKREREREREREQASKLITLRELETLFNGKYKQGCISYLLEKKKRLVPFFVKTGRPACKKIKAYPTQVAIDFMKEYNELKNGKSKSDTQNAKPDTNNEAKKETIEPFIAEPKKEPVKVELTAEQNAINYLTALQEKARKCDEVEKQLAEVKNILENLAKLKI